MRELRLSDRRRITFEEFGDAEGTPTFFFHGTPSSSRIGQLLDRAARQGRIRLIAANRPGIGGSSFQRVGDSQTGPPMSALSPIISASRGSRYAVTPGVVPTR